MVSSITSHHIGFDYPITNPVDCSAVQLCEGGLWHLQSEWCARDPLRGSETISNLFRYWYTQYDLCLLLRDTGNRYCEVGTKSGNNIQSHQQALLILRPITVFRAAKAALTYSEQNPFIFLYSQNENPNPYV
jgi:hypothetical protein